MYVERAVMSVSLYKMMLKELHTGHPGISRIKSLMPSYLYWPNMDRHREVGKSVQWLCPVSKMISS